MLEEAQADEEIETDYVQLVPAGAEARGAYQCADCGYGVSVQAALPQCPMCAGTAWERVVRDGWQLDAFTGPLL